MLAELGTSPPLSVLVLEVSGVPLQVPPAKRLYVTVPAGVKPPTVATVAVSYAASPTVSVPFHARLVAVLSTTVPTPLVVATTEKGSQTALDGT